MTDRRLTISTLRQPCSAGTAYRSQPDRLVPYLRMRGRWLEELGFARGSAVRVEVAPGRLVITPEMEASDA
jgi:toxic protein SymE